MPPTLEFLMTLQSQPSNFVARHTGGRQAEVETILKAVGHDSPGCQVPTTLLPSIRQPGTLNRPALNGGEL
jgi:hypothetical protein